MTVHLYIRPPCLMFKPGGHSPKKKKKKICFGKKRLATPRYGRSSETIVCTRTKWLCSWLILMTWCLGRERTATCNGLCLRCAGPSPCSFSFSVAATNKTRSVGKVEAQNTRGRACCLVSAGRDWPPFVSSSSWSVPPPAVVVGYDFFFFCCCVVARKICFQPATEYADGGARFRRAPQRCSVSEHIFYD